MLVRGVQGPGDRARDLERVGVRHPVRAAEPAREALALQELHDDVRAAIGHAPEVVGLDDPCLIEATERASLKNRVTMSRLLEISGSSSFTATGRPRDSCTARYTAPMPPSPISAVIS